MGAIELQQVLLGGKSDSLASHCTLMPSKSFGEFKSHTIASRTRPVVYRAFDLRGRQGLSLTAVLKNSEVQPVIQTHVQWRPRSAVPLGRQPGLEFLSPP